MKLGDPIKVEVDQRGELMTAILEMFPNRHNAFTRTLLWNTIRRERGRRMRYRGFETGVWLVGPKHY